MRTLILILFTLSINGQALVASFDFESGWQGWQTCYSSPHTNQWQHGTLAGNGNTLSGSNSLFVTQDGTSFNYGNSNNEKIVVWTTLNATGYTNGFTMSFDFRGYGEDDIDALWVCICFANPSIVTNWMQTSSGLDLTPNWANITWVIPSPTYMNNNPSIKIGFMFRSNNTNCGQGFAIDNFMLVANQSPLSLDTTNTLSIPQQTEIDNPVLKCIDITGREITEPHGLYFIVRKYGKPLKVFKQ